MISLPRYECLSNIEKILSTETPHKEADIEGSKVSWMVPKKKKKTDKR